MVILENDKLIFSFEDVHPRAICEIDFKRTLRLPDDNKKYPLPASLGKFPLVHTEDFKETLPDNLVGFGGVMLPMYQSEAMWINFNSPKYYPFAIKIAAGKINAVTGEQWENGLNDAPQDYLSIPDQPWLDGFHTEDGTVRQFVAMPLGQGYSVEEQLTREATFGGIQIIVYPMKAEVYETIISNRERNLDVINDIQFSVIHESSPAMGLGAGGRIEQDIYEDDYELEDYDLNSSSRCFVNLINSDRWHSITGKQPPTRPFTAKDYEQAGVPWFEFYSENKALSAGKKFDNIKSVASQWLDKNGAPLEGNESISTKKILKISKSSVKDGNW